MANFNLNSSIYQNFEALLGDMYVNSSIHDTRTHKDDLPFSKQLQASPCIYFSLMKCIICHLKGNESFLIKIKLKIHRVLCAKRTQRVPVFA